MAFEISTATDHFDLLAKIRTFVTTTLPVAQRHVLLSNVTEGTGVGDGLPFTRNIFQAPGAGGLNQIFYGIKTYQSVSSDYYNFQIDGFTGYVPGNAFESQPGSIYGNGQTGIGVTLWNQAIPYWLVADGSGFTCVAKIQNAYITFGAGFILPYGTPVQYPYPLLVHGNLPTASATRYSVAFTNGWKGSRANFVLRYIDGTWLQVQNLPYHHAQLIRNTNSDSNNAVGYYGLHPCELGNLTGSGNLFGTTSQILYISGFNNAVENTQVSGGITYVVIRDGTSSGNTDYIALKLA